MEQTYFEELESIINNGTDWSCLNGKKILLVGASGMIGTVITDLIMLLSKQYDINITVMGRSVERICSRFEKYLETKNFSYICADVCMPLSECGDFDYIVHAASNTHPMAYSTDPVGTITANTIGTDNLLKYAATHGSPRFVFLSSVEIYGENRGDADKFDEDYCGYINCNTLRAGYPESKRVGESLCRAYEKQYNVDVVIPRLCRIYGATMLDSDSKALAQFIKKAVNKEDIVLKSAGTQLFSYCYVCDAVEAIIKIMLDGESGQAYNISDSNSDITLKELAEILAEEAGTKVIFELPDNVEAQGYSTATKAVLSHEKINALGWKARYTISDGIKRTLYKLEHME